MRTKGFRLHKVTVFENFRRKNGNFLFLKSLEVLSGLVGFPGFSSFPAIVSLITSPKLPLMIPINRFVYIITSVACPTRRRVINDTAECLSPLDIHLRIPRGGDEVLRPRAAHRRDSQWESPTLSAFQNGGIKNYNPNKEIIK